MRNIKAASCSDKEEGEEDRVKTEEERKSETTQLLPFPQFLELI